VWLRKRHQVELHSLQSVMHIQQSQMAAKFRPANTADAADEMHCHDILRQDCKAQHLEVEHFNRERLECCSACHPSALHCCFQPLPELPNYV